MQQDHSNENLKELSFQNKYLVNAIFTNSDLRGTDFSGADLRGANFTNIKTGITPFNTVVLFSAALVVSLLSGYVSMLAGQTIHAMIIAPDNNTRRAGFAALVITILFIGYFYFKGGSPAIRHLLIPVSLIALLAGIFFYFTGIGTGRGMLYLVLANIFVVVMFILGTVARAAAGTLSSALLFLVVALAGGIFGKSIGGGIGSVIMALSCAMISKRALKGKQGFDTLQKLARMITVRFGTSFRNANLNNAMFSGSKVSNADFTDANLSQVYWGNSKRSNCIINNQQSNYAE